LRCARTITLDSLLFRPFLTFSPAAAQAIDPAMWLIKKVLFYPLRGHQASNIRLTLCPSCSSFADPFVEHPPLLLFLDLVLLKPGVYRHVLFNRGHEPVQAGRNVDEDKLRGKSEGRERVRPVPGLICFQVPPADLSGLTLDSRSSACYSFPLHYPGRVLYVPILLFCSMSSDVDEPLGPRSLHPSDLTWNRIGQPLSPLKTISAY
jgi:hypothetical protein